MKELCDVLQSFAEATDLTQGEKIVAVSSVLPCVNHHLEKLKQQVGSMIHSLQCSLKKRFRGIFVNIIYIISIILLTLMPLSVCY